LRILIAGGGTGGHLFPGIAMAKEFEAKDPQNRVLFVGARRKIPHQILKQHGYNTREVESEAIVGKDLTHAVYAAYKVLKGLRQSFSILKDFSPHLVVGVGGYSSGPMVLAAHMLRIKTALHEQNVLPGLTNRILSRFVDKIFISFPESKNYFSGKRTILTGNPIRECLLKYQVLSHSKRGFTLLIIGGSQGAHQVNARFISCLPYLEDLKESLNIIHQTGERDFEYVSNAYRDLPFERKIFSFINDMAWAYGQSDLVIGRAGATTIAELTALGKPSILIPYPYASDNHQEMNARVLVKKGAAHMIRNCDLNEKRLADTIRMFYYHPQTLKIMANKAANLGRRNASKVIVEECYKLVNPKG